MTVSLSHRGPDGKNTWQNAAGNALLGHCRLSIIDLSEQASQPMHYLDRYTIVHNGEIYNYIELREELQKLGYSFQTGSDTEVILAAYDYYNEECPEHFDGMFAFAIWDQQEQQLFAARDRFGEKPFYYSFNGDQFVFASEIKALWAAGIERRPNLQMLFNFITIGYTDNPGRPEETFYDNICKLPAASWLYFTPSENDLLINKYWDIDLSVQRTGISDQQALEQFDHLFALSVRRRLRSDVPVGTSLSGGLDSSSIAAVIYQSQQAGNTASFTTFTAVFPGFANDETTYARQVAGQFGLLQQTIAITVDDFVNDWERFLHFQEEPFGSASAYAQYKVFELARQHNVKVLLDGQGADETMAGYRKYYKWYWQELFQKRKLVRSGELRAARQLGIQENFTFKNVIASLFPDIASAVLEKQYLANALQQEDLNTEFVQLQSKEAYYTPPATFNLNGALYFNTCMHGLEELLRIADRNSMAHGREVRLPFLSHELVEFIFSLPSHFKIRDGWTKWLLRQSKKDVLPPEITWRKNKIGFEPPQKEWMLNARVQDMIHEARKKLVSKNILKPETVNKPVAARASYEANTFDWRYLASAYYL